MTDNKIVSLINLIHFVGDVTEAKRLFEEGENVCNSKHIIACGKCNANKPVEKGLQIKALVIQSSDVFDVPHQVSFSLIKGKVHHSSCTCDEVSSMRCKHIVGTLIYLNRMPPEDLKDLSTEDIFKNWDQLNHTYHSEHKTEPVSNFCHFKPCKMTDDMKKFVNDNPQVLDEYLFNSFLENSPDSELAMHRNGRKQSVVGPSVPVPTNIAYSDVIKFALTLMNPPQNLNLQGLENTLDESCQKFYESVVITPIRSADLCARTSKRTGTDEWKKERLLRISTNNAYDLYTYTKNKNLHWDKKVEFLYGCSFNVKTGDITKTAGWQLLLTNKFKVARLGLFVNPAIPWLVDCPDGIVDRQYLLEIQYPHGGDRANIADILKTLPYIEGDFEEQTLQLKKRTSFFTQVNLAMGLMNLKKCYFMLFCSFDSSYVIIDVLFDPNLFEECVSVLERAYFCHILPLIKNIPVICAGRK